MSRPAIPAIPRTARVVNHDPRCDVLDALRLMSEPEWEMYRRLAPERYARDRATVDRERTARDRRGTVAA